MKENFTMFKSVKKPLLSEFTLAGFSGNFKSKIKQNNELPEIVIVTSYPPRECGIATYSQDLINGLTNQFSGSFKCVICALENNLEHHIYSDSVKYTLNTDVKNSYVKTAFQINKNENIKLVVFQHEFGFFEQSLNEFSAFFTIINKPIVFVFHTVLPKPNLKLLKSVIEMANLATAIVVMTNDAAIILKNDYGINLQKINIIQHGTHLIAPISKLIFKKEHQLEGKKILSTFGLISASKSIETTLNALPTIIKKHPDVLFLILGKTHPIVVKHDGEEYRNMLTEMVALRGLQNNVRFVNEYLPLPTLLAFLQISDIYLFTSKDPNQAVSGTFAYALSCGCSVISTPIPHAKEILNGNNGRIIDFNNPLQLAKEVILLLDNEKLRNEISLNSFHKMAATVWQNSAIAHALLFAKLCPKSIQLKYNLPEINLKHIRKLTTQFGMIQFSKIATPNLQSGYTLDDNARALIAVARNYKLFGNDSDLHLINTYLQFIAYCMQTDGTFLNYVNKKLAFSEQNFLENLEDSTGRAIWALGYITSFNDYLPSGMANKANQLLTKALPHLEKIHSTRAMAFVIKGLHYQADPKNSYLIETFANRMAQMYKHEKTTDWKWFENSLTYGNSLLSEAMLCAYISTNKSEYKVIAKTSFDFLLSKTFVNNKIKVISNKGWHLKNNINLEQTGGEQPIDVAYTIMTLEKFNTIFAFENYDKLAINAFNWFLGENHLQQIVYNPCTGGSYDGIEEFNVNLNQGAESTVSYLMARLSIEQIKQNQLALIDKKMELKLISNIL